QGQPEASVTQNQHEASITQVNEPNSSEPPTKEPNTSLPPGEQVSNTSCRGRNDGNYPCSDKDGLKLCSCRKYSPCSEGYLYDPATRMCSNKREFYEFII